MNLFLGEARAPIFFLPSIKGRAPDPCSEPLAGVQQPPHDFVFLVLVGVSPPPPLCSFPTSIPLGRVLRCSNGYDYTGDRNHRRLNSITQRAGKKLLAALQ